MLLVKIQNLRIKTKPGMAWVDATVFVWILCTYIWGWSQTYTVASAPGMTGSICMQRFRLFWPCLCVCERGCVCVCACKILPKKPKMWGEHRISKTNGLGSDSHWHPNQNARVQQFWISIFIISCTYSLVFCFKRHFSNVVTKKSIYVIGASTPFHFPVSAPENTHTRTCLC